MRDRYFRMYESIKFKECFYAAHGERSRVMYNAFSAVTIGISILSVLIWSISKSMPALWAIVIAAAQFAQAFSVKLPWADRIAALRYLLPELKNLSIRIDRDWLALDVMQYDDEKIFALISDYESSFSALESQFTQYANFPEIRSVLDNAEKDQRAYFYSRYPSTQYAEGSETVNAG